MLVKWGGCNVLSLFDGISCGQVALERAGIEVNNYYASEIDKYAIQITQKNYPNTIQLGDINNINFKQFVGKIDIIIGGSPCQDLSIANANREGLKGKRSGLFYKYVEALEVIKPKYFLLENVASMKNSERDIISEILGVQPIMINSATITAQNRRRYYWTNIPQIHALKSKNIKIKDIVESNVEDKYYLSEKMINNFINSKSQFKFKPCTLADDKLPTLTARYFKMGKTDPYIQDEKGIRKLTPIECERIQTVPENYTKGISNTQRYKCLGNGWTVDVIAHIFKGLKEREV